MLGPRYGSGVAEVMPARRARPTPTIWHNVHRQRPGSAASIRHDAQGRGTATVRCPDGVVDRPTGAQRLHVANALLNSMLLGRPLFRPTGHRQHHADGTCDDPDGVGIRRAGTADHSQQGLAGLDRVRRKGRSSVVPKVSPRSRQPWSNLSAGNGILKVAALVGCGSGTVQRVKREVAIGIGKGSVSCGAVNSCDHQTYDAMTSMVALQAFSDIGGGLDR